MARCLIINFPLGKRIKVVKISELHDEKSDFAAICVNPEGVEAFFGHQAQDRVASASSNLPFSLSFTRTALALGTPWAWHGQIWRSDRIYWQEWTIAPHIENATSKLTPW